MKLFLLNILYINPDDTLTQSEIFTTKENAAKAFEEAKTAFLEDESIDTELAVHENGELDIWLHDADDDWFGDYQIYIRVEEKETDTEFSVRLER